MSGILILTVNKNITIYHLYLKKTALTIIYSLNQYEGG